MERLEGLLAMFDNTFDSKRKRHIAGGILLSTALLFSGLALTVITLKSEGERNEFENN